MTKQIDLTVFCSGPDRPIFMTPWTRDGYTYATDGHVLVRVPHWDDIPNNDKAPDVAGRYAFKKPVAEPVEIPALPPPELEPCPWCDDEEDGEECFGCTEARNCTGWKGGGIVRKRVEVTVGGVLYADRYIELIKELPGLKFYPAPYSGANRKANAAYFTFDGGDGLLMPLKG